MKKVKAVAPFYNEKDFKTQAYKAWVRQKGEQAKAHYPWRAFHGVAYRWDLPSLGILKSKKEARLRFVEPVSMSFDTFPDYARYEIIPLIWDCWPKYIEKTVAWLKKHNVKSVIFTSSQIAEMMKERLPDVNVFKITEGIEVSRFGAGELLKERVVNLFEMGYMQRRYFNRKYPDVYKRLNQSPQGWTQEGFDGLKRFLENTRVIVIYPRSVTEPNIAQGIETLTQRYWECMLSRIVMVGHAPQELVDLVGYNPVIELNSEDEVGHVQDIIEHIGDYQAMVDHNREVALRMAPWEIRMKQVMEWLKGLGYEI